jgi:hypothetical protein
MSLPGPFLAGQRLTAGQLNDATQKTLDSVSVTAAGSIGTTAGTTELNISRFALGPVPLVAGGLYQFEVRALFTNTVATDQFTMLIRRDTALTGALVGELLISPQPSVAGTAYEMSTWSDLPSLLDENGVSFFFSLKRLSGSGTMSTFGQLVTAVRPGTAIRRIGYSSEYRVSA